MAVYTFTANKLTAGSPIFAALTMILKGPRALIVAKPVLGQPILRPFFPNVDGHVPFITDWQSNDPEVWHLNRLKFDDEDQVPVREAIFSNHNDNILLECDGDSLIGRGVSGRGAAHKITVAAPLALEGRTLRITGDITGGGGGGFGEVEIPLVVEDGVLKLAVATPLVIINGALDLDTTGIGGIAEAPSDALAYGRRSAAWVRVLAITDDVCDGGNF
jgi:hypothetical protein